MGFRGGVCLIAVDIGTTNAKAALFEQGIGIVRQETESYSLCFPKPGYVEQDPEEVLAAAARAIRRLVEGAGIAPEAVDAIVLDGIWQSLIPVDGDGQALARALTGADSRSIRQNERLMGMLGKEDVRRRTGCALHPMYHLSRIEWIREESPDIFRRATSFISIKEYVIERFFGTRVVDHSIASGTGIWNMSTLDWDADLLAEVGLSAERFSPCVEPTFALPGLNREYATLLGLLEGTPAVIGAADGALSHLGSIGSTESMMSMTVGTGAALRRMMPSPRTIQGTEAWCYYLAESRWLQGGVLNDAGSALQWFADNVMPPAADGEDVFAQMNRLAEESPPGADGLCFIPFLSGERCPHYNPQARGALYGLGFSHTRSHLVRALMEGIAFNLYSIYRMLASGAESEIVVTGGILKSPVWLRIVADFFGKALWRPRVQEAATLGGAIIGMRALGAIDSLDEASTLIGFSGKQEPDRDGSARYRDILGAYDRLYADLFSRNLR
jgi:gluconokinase